MSLSNYNEWSREQKEEFAERKMQEMKLKNEQFLRRYAEVENDRIQAESKNSAVTSLSKNVKKETFKSEPKKPEREWDRGKLENDGWNSDIKGPFKGYRTGNQDKKVAYRSGQPSRTYEYAEYHRDSKRARGCYGYRNISTSDCPKQRKVVHYESFRHFPSSHDKSYKQNSYKPNVRKYKGHSRSSSQSESEYRAIHNPVQTLKASFLWENDRISEDQTKKTLVEKWVKSVNKTNHYINQKYPQNEKVQNQTKFDHIACRSESSKSDDAVKSTAKENISHKSGYHKSQCMVTSDVQVYSVGQNNRYQNEQISQFPASCSKNKVRFDNKNLRKDKFSKNVKRDSKTFNNELWKNAAIENVDNFENTKARKYIPNHYTKKCSDASWKSAEKYPADDGHWNTTMQSQIDDGHWSAAVQSEFDDGHWGAAVQSELDDGHWGTLVQSQVDDGQWNTTDQAKVEGRHWSDIEQSDEDEDHWGTSVKSKVDDENWDPVDGNLSDLKKLVSNIESQYDLNLSFENPDFPASIDDEIDCLGNMSTNLSETDYKIQSSQIEIPTADSSSASCGIATCTQQCDLHLKSVDGHVDSCAKNEKFENVNSKENELHDKFQDQKKIKDGCEDCESSHSLNEISEKLKSCLIRDDREADETGYPQSPVSLRSTDDSWATLTQEDSSSNTQE